MQHDIDIMVDWIIAAFMANGKDVTIKEIAAGMDWSEAKTRKVMASAPAGVPMELESCQESRTSWSHDYKMFSTGAHKVWVYGPTRATLAARLKNASELIMRMSGMEAAIE